MISESQATISAFYELENVYQSGDSGVEARSSALALMQGNIPLTGALVAHTRAHIDPICYSGTGHQWHQEKSHCIIGPSNSS